MKNINAHRKGLVQSILATIDTVKSRVSTLAAQPSIESACPLATYSRDYRRINPLDQRFPFPGQRRPGLNLSLSFQLDRSTRHIPCNRISRKKYLPPAHTAFPLHMQMRTKWNTYIHIRVYSNRRIRGWTLNRNREEFQGLRRGRNARRILRWINRQVSMLCVRRWTLVKVTYTPRDGIFPGVNWIQVDRREIEWKPPRGTLERGKRL